MSNHHAHHIQLDVEKIKGTKVALLPGDPGRVPVIAQGLTNASEIAYQREFRSYLGYLNNHPVLITSTGCGGPSLSICVEELARLGVRNFIRVGSTGAIQEHINIGDTIISHAAVRLDGASKSFAPIEYPAVADLDLTNALVQAARDLKIKYYVGITASADTFYQGQERYDTYTGFVPSYLRGSVKDWKAMRVTNFEMESGTLFTMCATMGLRAATVCGVVANREQSEKIVPAEVFRQSEQNASDIALGAVQQLIATGLIDK